LETEKGALGFSTTNSTLENAFGIASAIGAIQKPENAYHNSILRKSGSPPTPPNFGSLKTDFGRKLSPYKKAGRSTHAQTKDILRTGSIAGPSICSLA